MIVDESDERAEDTKTSDWQLLSRDQHPSSAQRSLLPVSALTQWACHISGSHLMTALLRCASESSGASPSCHGDDDGIVVVAGIVVLVVVEF